MAKKTVLRNMLSKWGILSIEMQNAYSADTKIVQENILDDPMNVQGSLENVIEPDFTINDETGEVQQSEFEGTQFEG